MTTNILPLMLPVFDGKLPSLLPPRMPKRLSHAVLFHLDNSCAPLNCSAIPTRASQPQLPSAGSEFEAESNRLRHLRTFSASPNSDVALILAMNAAGGRCWAVVPRLMGMCPRCGKKCRRACGSQQVTWFTARDEAIQGTAHVVYGKKWT